MSLLVIAGITISVAEARKAAPERIGSSSRTFNGTLRSTERVNKRGWSIKTLPMLETDCAILENSVTLAAQVACSGDLCGNITCEVSIGEQEYITDVTPDGKNFKRIMNFIMREV